jgi:hypothetical protein
VLVSVTTLDYLVMLGCRSGTGIAYMDFNWHSHRTWTLYSSRSFYFSMPPRLFQVLLLLLLLLQRQPSAIRRMLVTPRGHGNYCWWWYFGSFQRFVLLLLTFIVIISIL